MEKNDTGSDPGLADLRDEIERDLSLDPQEPISPQPQEVSQKPIEPDPEPHAVQWKPSAASNLGQLFHEELERCHPSDNPPVAEPELPAILREADPNPPGSGEKALTPAQEEDNHLMAELVEAEREALHEEEVKGEELEREKDRERQKEQEKELENHHQVEELEARRVGETTLAPIEAHPSIAQIPATFAPMPAAGRASSLKGVWIGLFILGCLIVALQLVIAFKLYGTEEVQPGAAPVVPVPASGPVSAPPSPISPAPPPILALPPAPVQPSTVPVPLVPVQEEHRRIVPKDRPANAPDENPRRPTEPPAGAVPTFKDVASVIRQHISELQTCNRLQQERDATVKGRMVMRILVNGQGRVDETGTTSEDFTDTFVAGCIAQAIQRMRFPAFSGSPQEFSFPFIVK